MMSAHGSMLQTAVVFLLAAVVTVLLAKRLQLSAVLGYLLAGVVIGPSALRLIDNPESISHISELGIVLLLFIIGLEISPRRLWVMRKAVFGAGLAQVALTSLIISVGAWALFSQSINVAIVIGVGLALSSTAFGLQLLAERKALNTRYGRLAFAILLFQDIAAVPLIAMIALMGGVDHSNESASNVGNIIKIVLCIGAVIIAGRYLLRPIFRLVVKTGLQDLATATALMVVMGTAWLMELAGVSMALGTFLAGVLLADSEYRHELESQIEPFKGLLLGLFFMSVGMSANLQLLLDDTATIVGLTLLLIAVKFPLIYLVGKFIGFTDTAGGVRLGLLLAGGGEFAFVIFDAAYNQGIFSTAIHDRLVLIITLSMAVMPFLVLLAMKLYKPAPTPQPVPSPEHTQIHSNEPRVIIAGMGRMGQIISRILRAQNIPFIGLDLSVETIELTRSIDKIPIYYGNPQRPEILRAVHAEQAEYFIVATDDPEMNLETTRVVRQLYPHLKIIARARNRQHVHHLLDLEAEAVRETFHSSLEMSRKILIGLGLSEENATSRIRIFQEHDEQVLAAQHLIYDDAAAVIQNAREARKELQALFNADIEKK